MTYAEEALTGVEAVFGVAATYTEKVEGAAPVEITVVASTGNDPAVLSGQRVGYDAAAFEVRRSVLPNPKPEALIVLTATGERWRISGKPESRDGDHDRLIWVLRCRPDAEQHRRPG